MIKKEIKIEQLDDSDDESRFSMGCTVTENAYNNVDSNTGESSDDNSDISHEGNESIDDEHNYLSQEEIDAAKKAKIMKKRAEERKYGDRFLLGRQTFVKIKVEDQDGIVTEEKKATGMMKLGGGNQSPDMHWRKEKDRVSFLSNID